MNTTEYLEEQDQLVIRDLLTGRVIRCEFEVRILQILPLMESDACLVLLDPAATKKPTFENLLKVRRDGVIEWKAQLPHSHDAFVSVVNRGDHIEANTWSGERVEIDLSTGWIKNVRFVK